MKNRAGFYIKSANCKEAINNGREYISFKCPESEARALGVEWHHGGSGVIAFFPVDEKDRKKVEELRCVLSFRKIKTKKAALEYLEHTTGDFKIPYKLGKFGKFFNFWGNPDGFLFIDESDPNFNDCRALLNF